MRKPAKMASHVLSGTGKGLTTKAGGTLNWCGPTWRQGFLWRGFVHFFLKIEKSVFEIICRSSTT